MSSVWRLHLNTSQGNIAQYCIENHCAAVGWNLREATDSERRSITCFEEFQNIADRHYDNYDALERLVCDTRENDLIWIRNEGKYFLGRVTSETEYKYNPEAINIDACNQLINIDWFSSPELDESGVPGAINTAFIQGSAFQRIKKEGVFEFSALLYNKLCGKDIYTGIELRQNQETFYSLLSPADCEDLLYFWLYKKYGYICVPSTNKKSTPKYEFVLIDPKTGENKYLQVKKGNINLNVNDYKDLPGDIWLLTTGGEILNENAKNLNVHSVNPTDLYEFALDEDSKNIISSSINTWLELISNEENKRIIGRKGILFDTNDRKQYMLDNNRVSAWGTAKNQIDSFHEGDIVFFYDRGHGVSAAGKVKSDRIDKENEAYKNIEIIKNSEEYISAADIKRITQQNYWFAKTAKVPFLSEEATNNLLAKLK